MISSNITLGIPSTLNFSTVFPDTSLYKSLQWRLYSFLICKNCCGIFSNLSTVQLWSTHALPSQYTSNAIGYLSTTLNIFSAISGDISRLTIRSWLCLSHTALPFADIAYFTFPNSFATGSISAIGRPLASTISIPCSAHLRRASLLRSDMYIWLLSTSVPSTSNAINLIFILVLWIYNCVLDYCTWSMLQVQ